MPLGGFKLSKGLYSLTEKEQVRDLSVQTLIGRCIKGERSAWDEFVERFSALIYWAIKRTLKRTGYLYNRQDTEDIFQNVFCLVWKENRLKQVRERERIYGWLAMVAANCTHNFFRNKGKELIREKLETEKIQLSDYGANTAFARDDIYTAAEKAFDCLTHRERIILELSYRYDKTHQEIGEILKIPANTVSSIIKRTRESLKKRLTEEGYRNF